MRAQALWALAAVAKSTVLARQEAASAIIGSARRHREGDAAAQHLFRDFADAADQLIRLCNHTVDRRSASRACHPARFNVSRSASSTVGTSIC